MLASGEAEGALHDETGWNDKAAAVDAAAADSQS